MYVHLQTPPILLSRFVPTASRGKSGAWSKTMIGYGPEEQNFALELTYNYGIDSYKSGDDLQYICVQTDVEAAKAKAEAEGE